MNQPLPANRVALVVGLLLAFWHLAWVLLVASGFAKVYLDWVLGIHFLHFEYAVEPFHPVKAVFLVGFTFLCGGILGWIFAKLWGFFNRA